MDAVYTVLLALSLVGVLAYAFVVYQALKIFIAWAKDRWCDDWGKSPLLLRIPPKALTVLLVLVFLSVAV